MRALLREDAFVARIVLAFALLQLVVAGWDLPSSFGWENDGIAPRDLFGGIKFNLTSGEGHRYPLLQYLILGVLSLPCLLVAVARSEGGDYASLESAVLAVDVMTGISVVAKLLTITAASVTVLVLAQLARRTVSRNAGRWAALFAVTCLAFTYYGRTSNLDVPYLMWTVLAVAQLPKLADRGRFRDYALFAVLVAASMATKDQAYAAYVLTAPVYLLVLPAVRPRLFAAGSKHWRRLLGALGVGVLALGLLGGGLLNPTGFIARVRLLAGENSQSWRAYPQDLSGLSANLRDLAVFQNDAWWPWPVVALAWLGVGLAFRPHPQRAWRLLPLVAGVSTTLAFTLLVGRCGHRFLLPLGLWLAFYGGVACDALCNAAAERIARLQLGSSCKARLAERAVVLLLCLVLGTGAWRSLQLILTQWGDARLQVEGFLAALPRGSRVETYGLLVYQPRFDTSPSSPYRVQHVGRRDIKIPGVDHIDAPYSQASERGSDVLVILEYDAIRYLRQPQRSGRVASAQRRRSLADAQAVRFFQAATTKGWHGYRPALTVKPRLPRWATKLGAKPIRIHGSTGMLVWMLVRDHNGHEARNHAPQSAGL